MAKLIHHKLREATKGMNFEQKAKYLSDHAKKKKSAEGSSRATKIKSFMSQPVVNSKNEPVKKKMK